MLSNVASISSPSIDACIVKMQIDSVDWKALTDSESSVDVPEEDVLNHLHNDEHHNKRQEERQSQLHGYGSRALPAVVSILSIIM